ncbi:MAG: alpha/beta hydrolase [Timaviella obliquedivisa GSE-PSE-MK23-08B]|nr:alpha/beta hydrolase [Timaviella obliquedivisa GSE-PSE-MK23-08B]
MIRKKWRDSLRVSRSAPLRVSWRARLLFTILIALPFLVLNGIAFMQARSMTHFVSVRQRTAKPEQLALIDKIRVILTGVEIPRPKNQTTPQEIQLGYETHRIAIGQEGKENLEAWYIPTQKSRGLVLLFPPYGSSKAALLAPTKVFHDLGYDALLVDFRGAGGSTGNDTTLGVREAKDVAIAFTYSQKQWADKPMILYGASMGAVAVMRAVAIEKIEPAALILESPFDRLLNTVRHRFEVMGIPSFPSAELIVFWGGVQQGIDGFSHNPVDYARSIPCPVLLLHGERDQRVTVAEAAQIFERLPGQKHWQVFSSANGHGSLTADDTEQWQDWVSRFLKSDRPTHKPGVIVE